MNYYPGLQIEKFDPEGEDGSTERGFVVKNAPSQDGAFCRFWKADDHQTLRTRANSELTKYRNLRVAETHNQGFVDFVCGNIISQNSTDIATLEHFESGSIIVLQAQSGKAQNPVNPSFQIPVHHDTTGNYELCEPYSEARYLAVATIGYARDFSAYHGFIAMGMPLDLGIYAIANFGDKMSEQQVQHLIEKINLTRLSDTKNFRR